LINLILAYLRSLTGARKQAENGGFKLKCYKSADKPIKNLAYNKLARQQQQPTMNGGGKGGKNAIGVKEANGGGENGTHGTLGKVAAAANGNVLQLLALAKAARNATSVESMSNGTKVGEPSHN
jgi:hypothetical protein